MEAIEVMYFRVILLVYFLMIFHLFICCLKKMSTPKACGVLYFFSLWVSLSLPFFFFFFFFFFKGPFELFVYFDLAASD